MVLETQEPLPNPWQGTATIPAIHAQYNYGVVVTCHRGDFLEYGLDQIYNSGLHSPTQ
jgi:hypothetical protein